MAIRAMPPSLRLARSLIHEVREVRGGTEEEIELIINMQGLEKAHEMPVKDTEKAMDLKISSVIPFAGKTFLGSESESKKITDDRDGLQIVKKSLLPIVQKILAVAVDEDEDDGESDGGFVNAILSKIKIKQ